jgi:hypothetical protein
MGKITTLNFAHIRRGSQGSQHQNQGLLKCDGVTDHGPQFDHKLETSSINIVYVNYKAGAIWIYDERLHFIN